MCRERRFTDLATPADARQDFEEALKAALEHGIGDDREAASATPMGGGEAAFCITPTVAHSRNPVVWHAFVLRGNTWFDVMLLDTDANLIGDYPPFCEMLAKLVMIVH